ncbi:MAG: hypothetical protein ACON43_00515 [Flavobacteriaceae bacterium]
MQISFDAASYRTEEANIEKRMKVIDDALEWIRNQAPNVPIEFNGTDWYEFHNGFVTLFKQKYWAVNKNLIKLPISVDKALELMEIDLDGLHSLYSLYRSYPVATPPTFSQEGIWYPLERNDYVRYTKNADENKRVKLARKFIELMDEVKEVTNVNPIGIVQSTGQLVELSGDGEFQPHVPHQLNRGV